MICTRDSGVFFFKHDDDTLKNSSSDETFSMILLDEISGILGVIFFSVLALRLKS